MIKVNKRKINFHSLSPAPRGTKWAAAANKVIIQINYSAYLNTTISDINLLNVFWLLVTGAISNSVPEEFTMNGVSRRGFPGYSNRGWRCIMSLRKRKRKERKTRTMEERNLNIFEMPISNHLKNNLPTVVIGLPTGAVKRKKTRALSERWKTHYN